jgi:hypothetical protein
MGSVLPPHNSEPEFAQIYILDPLEQATRRNTIFNEGLDEELLFTLQQELEACNPLCQKYKSIRELEYGKNISRLKILLKHCEEPLHQEGQLQRKRRRRQLQERQYDLPTALEVAVLMPGEDTKGPRDIIVESRTNGCQRIYEDRVMYDPLHYILLHPMGDHGWSYKTYEKRVQGPRPKYISVCEFYAYRLQIRPLSDNDDRCYFWMHGRLCHEYVVDQYAKVESQRLKYIRTHQNDLRADLYRGVVDAMHSNVPTSQVGKNVVLPSSFIGGPRYMHQLFQDSMTIVSHFGKPDLFITFTCNPNWPEIQTEINKQQLPDQIPNDRPDLIDRLFNVKLEALLDDLINKHILGKVIAHTHVVEFQKRGLPHAHILLILHEDDKPRTTKDFDEIVSAEIPDPNTCPNLFQTVTSCMIHGPCGSLNTTSPCMKDGTCSKRYPRPFTNETTQNEDGYPTYRRREAQPYIVGHNRRQHPIDNRWVVPYNPYLSMKYDAHVNVEICATVKAVKYLYKYVYKGHDRAKMAVVNEIETQQAPQQQPPPVRDEIQEYMDARYISACESLWRIFQFDMQSHSQTVIRLQVHLEDEHRVTFLEDSYLGTVVEEQRNSSQLLGWFQLNKQDEQARLLTYPDIPKHYIWDKKLLKWERRKIDKAHDIITRLYFVNPKERERYCLRVLLLHAKGATGFEDLRTVDGHVFRTFRDAAIARGLMENDEEWYGCLQEATMSHIAPSLRQLFAMILFHCGPSQPLRLWTRFALDLSEDYLYYLQLEHGDHNDHDQRAQRRALSDIDKILKGVGSSLSAFPELPQVVEDPLGEIQNPIDRVELAEHARLNIDKFNAGQFAAFSAIIDALCDESDHDKLFFVDGPGGTGKTFLFNTLIDHVQGSLGKEVIVVASTGIAALILHGGNTAHTTFKIPLKIKANSTCDIPLRSRLSEKIKRADIIIWDEAPVQHRYNFEAVNRTFKDITKTNKLFGGKVVVFGGDFRQILPVIPRGSQSEIEDACLKNSFIWERTTVIKLTENMRVTRATGSQEFIDYLLRIGNGTQPTVTIGSHNDYIELPPFCLFRPSNTSRHNSPEMQLIRTVYDGIETHGLTCSMLSERVILSPLNADVERLNALATKMLCCDNTTTYLSQDSIPDDDDAAATIPPECLATINPSGLPPSKLQLKVGQPVVLLRNLDPSRGLCNGTRLIIRVLRSQCIQAEVMMGPFKGNQEFLFRIALKSDEGDCSSFSFHRCQFPIRPAFAMTINKSQGQTLSHVGLYLPRPVFTHGQLYVALSRCTNPRNVKILIGDKSDEEASGCYTRNIIYHGILRDES